MVGRKRKPTKLHLIQGTARPCRLNKKEPVAPNEPPRSAVDLTSKTAFWYGIVVARAQSLGVASLADSEMVMLAAVRLAEVDECNQDIALNGRTLFIREVKTYRGAIIYDKEGKPVESVRPIENPSVSRRAEAARHAQTLLVEFGLSPASRGKVSAGKSEQQPANPWEALK